MKGEAMRAIFNFMSLGSYSTRREMLRRFPLLSGCGRAGSKLRM
jgi:hypothetical protein